MTETLSRIEGPGDAELISAVRGGDLSAYGDLFERHVEAARRLARQLVGSADADDLVSDAYMKVLRVLQGGGGPDVAFRAYLLTAVRRLHVDKIRANAKLHTTDNLEMFDPGVPFRDTAVEGFESEAAAKAFQSLPERWQAVLWHTEVEGQKPAEVAALLGMSPNSVSALAYRAREGLRQAFLNSHIADLEDDECTWTHEHLGPYIRGGASKRDAAKVEKHIDECRKCMGIYIELTEVNNNLAAILAPLLLGSAGMGYLATAGLATKGGLLLFLDRGKDWVASNSQAAAVAGVAAAGLVVAGSVFALTAGGDDKTPAADIAAPPGATSTTGPSGSDPSATDGPTDEPTDEPSDSPTDEPTDEPGDSPTDEPTVAPTEEPTEEPTQEPTEEPTEEPVVDTDISYASAPTVSGTDGDYTVTVAVVGIPSGETVTVETTSAPAGSARTSGRQYFAGTSDSTADGGVTVTCPDGCVLTKASPSLTLTAKVTGTTAQTLTINLVPSDGIKDTTPGNNARTLTLQPKVVTPPPVEYDLVVTAEALGQGSGKFRASIDGLPSGTTGTLEVRVPGLLAVIEVTNGPCDATSIGILGDTVLTCTGLSNGDEILFDLSGILQGAPTVTGSLDQPDGYVDTDPDNNSVTIT